MGWGATGEQKRGLKGMQPERCDLERGASLQVQWFVKFQSKCFPRAFLQLSPEVR